MHEQYGTLAEFEELGITTDPVKLRNMARRIQRFMEQKEVHRLAWQMNPPKRINPNPAYANLGLEDMQTALSYKLLALGSA